MTKKINWTQRHVEFIRANQSDMTRIALFKKLQRAFDDLDPNASVTNLQSLLERLGLKNNSNGQFKVGLKPWSKGKRGYMSANKTSFKKGKRAHNLKSLGCTRITRDGYIEIKTDNPNIWRLLHRVVWEEVHGKIPAKHCLRFLDNNRQNCKLSNLMLLSYATNAAINKSNPASTHNCTLNKAIILTETLKQKIKINTKKRCSYGKEH